MLSPRAERLFIVLGSLLAVWCLLADVSERKVEPTRCSETSVNKNNTLGNNPKSKIKHFKIPTLYHLTGKRRTVNAFNRQKS